MVRSPQVQFLFFFQCVLSLRPVSSGSENSAGAALSVFGLIFMLQPRSSEGKASAASTLAVLRLVVLQDNTSPGATLATF